jgi:uncharacterized membrane protein
MTDLMAFNREVWMAEFIGGAVMCLGWIIMALVWDRCGTLLKRRR